MFKHKLKMIIMFPAVMLLATALGLFVGHGLPSLLRFLMIFALCIGTMILLDSKRVNSKTTFAYIVITGFSLFSGLMSTPENNYKMITVTPDLLPFLQEIYPLYVQAVITNIIAGLVVLGAMLLAEIFYREPVAKAE